MLNNYALSQQRYEELRKVVVAGKEAKYVLKYANQFEEIVKALVLKTALDNPSGLEEMARYYKVASDFCNILRTAVELGKQKDSAMKAMREAVNGKDVEGGQE